MWWLISNLEREDDLAESLGSPWYGPDNQWMAAPWLIDSPRFAEKYAHSFMWGAGMVTAMVPFDIMPITVLEVWVTISAMFIGLVLNAIVISSLTTALSTMYSKKQVAGKQLDTIRNYLMLKAVPNDVRSRVLEYYEYLLTSSQSRASSIKYETMPANLAAQLALSINRKLAATCIFLRDVSNASVVTLISAMQPAIFVPGQLIVFEGHPLVAAYFINRGLVQLREKTHPVGTLRDNDNFGLDDCLAAMDAGIVPEVRHTVQAVGYCDVMSLAVDKLTETLQTDVVFRKRRARTPANGKAAGRTQKLGFAARQIMKRSFCTSSTGRGNDPGTASDDGGDKRSQRVPPAMLPPAAAAPSSSTAASTALDLTA
jgi:hypothetical protein